MGDHNRFKKLSLIAVLAIFIGFSGMAYAGTLTVTGGAKTFANEIFGPNSATTVLPNDDDNNVEFHVVYTMATAPTKNTPFHMIFTLDNGAKWGANLSNLTYDPVTLTDADANTLPSGEVTIFKESGGTIGKDSVKFRVFVKEDMNVGDKFTLDFKIKNANALATANTEFKINVELPDAIGFVDTKDDVVYATSADGVKLELRPDTDHDEFRIDLRTESKLFVDLDPSQPGIVDAATKKEVILGIVNITNMNAKEDDGRTEFKIGEGDANSATKGTLTIDGIFNASKGVSGGLYLDINGNGVFDTGEAFRVSATKATLTMNYLKLKALAESETGYKIHMVVDGDTKIDEMKKQKPPLATFKITYGNTTYTENDKLEDVGLNEVKKNGSFARKTFLLDPDSKFDTLIRITNPSQIEDAVYLTLINDEGESCNFNLDQVPDIFNQKISGDLPAGASTGLIYVKKLFEVAQSQCSGFDVVPNDPVNFPKPGKLRLDVEAVFGETGEYTGVVVDALVPMTDGTGFVMLPSNPY
jgi:hypothetical protein